MKYNTYQNYAENMVYKNDKPLDYLLFEEGWVTKTFSAYFNEYNQKDHPGNMRVTFQPNDSNTITKQVEGYYLFGRSYLLIFPAGTNKYLYNGKEKQDDVLSGTALDLYDYGARFYDPAIGRWHTIDPKAESYLSYSPYNYVLNNPMFFVDPNGEDVYLFYYLRGNHHEGKEDKESNSMFWAAAMTRATDFLNSEEGEGDTYVFRGIDSMDDIKGDVEGDVAANKEQFGKTAEFGLWSHGGADGPFRENKNGSFDQLSVKDWGKIDFNWSSDAKAGFYGCRTAMPESAEDGKSFSALLSGQKNMRNVDVAGRTHRSWPSPFTDVRQPTDNIANGKHIYPTYMVGSDKSFPQRVNTMLGSPTYAQPMAVYQNGVLIRFEHQPGKKR